MFAANWVILHPTTRSKPQAQKAPGESGFYEESESLVGR